ncbi:ABC-2 type transport system permease protein [Nocardioides thalensis]|uniref:Transport permease protein n=1 Tax=Nocardioides thalensis TaxID=1914755 RepID=A0A853C2U3_9ACTN|nr:ABC transporter permease [Nocardioides thalensis]NYJ02500.1 ABC-2 type transport system permease protein [Nocardioides thalensis]
MTIEMQMTAPAVTTSAARRTSDYASRPTTWFGDVWTSTIRELRPVLHNPPSVLFAMVQPLVFLGLFAPLLPESEGGSALQWFVPGIVTMTALMSASFTGANLSEEIISGSHERILVSPLRRSAVMVGKALREVVPLVLQTLIIVAAVTPFSFDLHALGVVVGIVVLVPFSIGLASLSIALAGAVKDQAWVFWTVQQTAVFPLLLLAGVLLPLDGAPKWLRVASDLNPMTYVVDAERALFAGDWSAGTVLAGLAASAIVGAFGLAVGVRGMNRAS